MPNFKMTSAKEIMIRVLRSTGYRIPSVFHDDILEFIPEGIGELQMTRSLVTTSSGDVNCPGEILINNHCAQLPCGFISIIAVEDENGRRIPEGGDVTDFTSQTSIRHSRLDLARTSVFNVDPFTHQTSDGLPADDPGAYPPFYTTGEDLTPIPESSRPSYYKIQGNYIQTSFECGYIKLHYLALPVDKEGYPLIPDNENFKRALEWHIIRRLIGAGYEHKVFTYNQADEQFEKFAARALSEVSYPSLDSMARANASTVRLIPPQNYNEDFFIFSETQERIR